MEENRESIDSTNSKLVYYDSAARYWSQIPATIDGMLGGFGFISCTDIKGSQNFLKHLFMMANPPGEVRAADCGAGIGRVTKNLLSKFFSNVDLVEQNPKFLKEACSFINAKRTVINCFNVGLQDFSPEPETYDVIWSQWVLGHLTDVDLVSFFKACKQGLKPNGLIVVKENITSSRSVEVDDVDSSVTRPIHLFVDLYQQAGLKCIYQQKQSHFPKGIYQVIMFALRPDNISATENSKFTVTDKCQDSSLDSRNLSSIGVCSVDETKSNNVEEDIKQIGMSSDYNLNHKNDLHNRNAGFIPVDGVEEQYGILHVNNMPPVQSVMPCEKGLQTDHQLPSAKHFSFITKEIQQGSGNLSENVQRKSQISPTYGTHHDYMIPQLEDLQPKCHILPPETLLPTEVKPNCTNFMLENIHQECDRRTEDMQQDCTHRLSEDQDVHQECDTPPTDDTQSQRRNPVLEDMHQERDMLLTEDMQQDCTHLLSEDQDVHQECDTPPTDDTQPQRRNPVLEGMHQEHDMLLTEDILQDCRYHPAESMQMEEKQEDCRYHPAESVQQDSHSLQTEETHEDCTHHLSVDVEQEGHVDCTSVPSETVQHEHRAER